MEHIVNTDDLEKCRVRMEEARDNTDASADVISSEIISLSSLSELTTFDRLYLLYIISRDEFELKHINFLDNTLRCKPWIDTALYNDIIDKLAHFKLKLNPESIQNITNLLYTKDIEGFQHAVIGLVTNFNGYIRRLGRAIWDRYNLQNSSIEIIEMDKNVQFAFIVSMLQDEGNPETRLPKLLPLLDSVDTTISLLLLHQLKPYILNYRGHIITQIDKLNIQNKDAIENIKEYYNSISNFTRERVKCKELNSDYNQMPIRREFSIAFQEYIQPLFKAGNTDSIWNLFKSVQLARGLCSRDKDGNEIELCQLKSSLPAGTMSNSLNYLEMMKQYNKLFMDWSTITNADDLWKIL